VIKLNYVILSNSKLLIEQSYFLTIKPIELIILL